MTKNYRPISLFSVLGKFVERLFCTRLDVITSQLNIVIPKQFVFRPKLCTTLQLFRVVEYILYRFASRSHTCARYSDIAKTYDTVSHSGLIYKLIRFKMPDTFTHLIRSFLSNWSFSGRYAKQFSTHRPISAGVPQVRLCLFYLISMSLTYSLILNFAHFIIDVFGSKPTT